VTLAIAAIMRAYVATNPTPPVSNLRPYGYTAIYKCLYKEDTESKEDSDKVDN
jgi:hypothetical protein